MLMLLTKYNNKETYRYCLVSSFGAQAIQQAGGLLLMEDLMRAEPWQGSIAKLSQWAHSVMRNTARGAVATSVNYDHPLYALMTSRH